MEFLRYGNRTATISNFEISRTRDDTWTYKVWYFCLKYVFPDFVMFLSYHSNKLINMGYTSFLQIIVWYFIKSQESERPFRLCLRAKMNSRFMLTGREEVVVGGDCFYRTVPLWNDGNTERNPTPNLEKWSAKYWQSSQALSNHFFSSRTP